MTLDRTQFSKSLKASVAESVKAAADIRKAFGEPLKLPKIPPLTIPNVPGAGRPRSDPETQKANAEIRALANQVNALKVAYERGEITQREFVTSMAAAATQVQKLRSGYAETTAQYGRLTNVLGIASRSITTANGEISKLGLSQQVAIGSTRNLTSQFGELQGAVAPLIGIAGLGGLSRITGDLATQANRVNVAGDILNLTLDRTGQTSEGAQQAISGVAAQLGLAEGQIIDYITQLVRVGFTTEQAQQALIAGGASALAFGKTAAVGIDAVTSALVTQNSLQLNTIGIAENIGKAMSDAAAANAQYGEQTANAAAAQAGLDIILKATSAEVDSLGKLTEGLAGSQNQAATAAFNFRQETGEMLIPLEILKNEALAGVIDGFNLLPGTAQAGAASFGAVTIGVSALATGLTALKPLLAATFLPPAGAVVIGIAVLTGMTAGLVALAQAAKENVTPFKTLKENAEATQKAIGKAEDKEALAGALEALSKQLDGEAKESVKNYAAEIRTAKGDVDELAASANKLVTQVQLDKALADRAALQAKLATVPAVQDADPNAIVADLQDRLNRSAEIQGLGIQLDLGIKREDGKLAVDVLGDIQQRAVLSAEAADLLSREFANVNSRINEVGSSAGDTLRDQRDDLTAYIRELRAALNPQAAEPENEPTNPVDPLLADAETKLREVQTLREKIEDAGIALSDAQAGVSKNVVARLKLEYAQGEREIITRTNRLIAEVQKQFDDGSLGQQEAIDQVAELQRIGFGELALNEQRYTEGVSQELERRKKVIGDAQAAINAIYASQEADRLRTSGDETGALKVELDAQLAAIQASLDEQLSAEGLTQGEIVALTRRSQAEKLAAQEDYGRKVAELAKQQAEATEQALRESSNQLADASIANIAGDIPKTMAQFSQQRKMRQQAFEDQLEDFKGDQTARTRLAQEFNQRELQYGQTHNREVNRVATDALKTYRDALKTHNDEVARIRNEARQSQIGAAGDLLGLQQAPGSGADLNTQAKTFTTLISLQREAADAASELARKTRESGATTEEVLSAKNDEAAAYKSVQDSIQGQIDKLKSLRDEQVAVVEGGSQVLQYLRNQQELSGDNQFIGSSDVREAVDAQITAYENLYRQAVQANAPIQERLELQERLKTLLSEAQTQGFDFKLDPSLLRLMESDVAGEITSFPGKAAEAVKTVKTLDEQIAAAGTQLATVTEQLATLLGAAATDEGLRLKVTVDKKGLDQAKVALREAFGPETANKIIAQASSMGLDAGKAIVRTLRQGLQDRGGLLSEVASLVRDVDRFFPHSDAKEGALSTLTASGRAIPLTLAKGMKQGSPNLSRMASELAAYAKPGISALPIPTNRPLTYASAAPSGGSLANGPVTIQVDARTSQATGLGAMSARSLVADVERELHARKLV